MTELNSSEPRKIQVLGPYTFSIGDTRSFSPYKKSGYVTEFKMGASLQFKSLEAALAEPKIEDCDFKDLIQRHVAFLALQEFKNSYSRLPKPYNEQDSNLFLDCARSVNTEFKFTEKLDEALLKKFSFTAMGNLSPMVITLHSLHSENSSMLYLPPPPFM